MSINLNSLSILIAFKLSNTRLGEKRAVHINTAGYFCERKQQVKKLHVYRSKY